MLVAALLGGLIGLDREYRAKDAGFRTHFLVALGSALFMIVSQFGFDEIKDSSGLAADPSRVAAQVVSGIGFIGAGTIIFQKHVLKGLTTAAGIWCTAAIGLACGSGMLIIAGVATLLTILCLEAFNRLLHRIGSKNISIRFTSPSREVVRQVIDKMEHTGITIINYRMEKEDHHEDESCYIVTMELRAPREGYVTRMIEMTHDVEGFTLENME